MPKAVDSSEIEVDRFFTLKLTAKQQILQKDCLCFQNMLYLD